MEKSILKKIIIENQEWVQSSPLMLRDIDLEESCNYVFVGPRRAGKSYLMLQHMQTLIKSGAHQIEDMLYINFEDERLLPMKAEDLGDILESYADLYPKRPLIYLDEIQNIEGWEKFARRLADKKYRVFVTGSNAQMLSRDIATTLGGRFVVKEIYPFSFEEYLQIQGVSLRPNWEYGEQKSTVVRMWQEYFRFGGFAETFELKDKRSWLSSLYQKILLGDIVARQNIRNPNLIQLLAKKLAESVMQPMTQSRLQHVISSAGAKIARNTLIEYLEHMKDAYLIFGLSNYSDRLMEREGTQKRYYTDNGLLHLFLMDGESKLLENMVAITLYKRYGAERVFYYNRNVEVDFYVPSESLAIQVSYSMSDDSTIERELRALAKLAKTFELSRALVVTADEERTLLVDGISVQLIPIWKWILQDPPQSLEEPRARG